MMHTCTSLCTNVGILILAITILLNTATAADDACDALSAAAWPPTIEEMQRRFKQATGHVDLENVIQGTSSPVSFIFRNLLTTVEIDDLIRVLRTGWDKRETTSSFSAIASIDKNPALNGSFAIQSLNQKLALLSGYPESHIEEGYFSVYNEGYQMSHLHLDNHHKLFEPQRTVSFVIYLRGEQTGLVGGRTIFPLAEIDHQMPTIGDHHDDVRRLAEIARAADTRLNSTYHEGEDPQADRICGMDASSSLCMAAYKRARVLCESEIAPEAVAVRARAGDAVMFSQRSLHGTVSVGAFHSSCNVIKHDKIVLAKFVREGPKPYFDEANFKDALAARKRTK